MSIIDPILFNHHRETQPGTLEEVVFQALGAASVCWDPMDCTGVFESDRAKKIGDEVVAWINEHYVTKEYCDEMFRAAMK